MFMLLTVTKLKQFVFNKIALVLYSVLVVGFGPAKPHDQCLGFDQ